MKINQQVIDKINAIADMNNGRITAEQVLESARDTDSPLHDLFEWDDTVAAEQYRKIQANNLIRKVPIKMYSETTTYQIAKFTKNPQRQSGYVSMTKVKSDNDMARDVLISAFQRARNAVNSARSKAKFLEMEALVDAFLKETDIAILKCRYPGNNQDDNNAQN